MPIRYDEVPITKKKRWEACPEQSRMEPGLPTEAVPRKVPHYGRGKKLGIFFLTD
jgi:hypothetical protein